jgi:glycosyltransferase involved in cell wall biosynthesis
LDPLSKTVVVVPCYNEAGRLQPDAFRAALSAFPWLHFLFVDDGSADETPRILGELRQSDENRIAVRTLSCNAGKAEAVRQGILAAFELGARIAGYWDADLSAPLDEIAGMRGCLIDREAWAVFGSRVRLLGRDIRRKPVRHYLGRLFATMAGFALALPVYDTQCGAKLFSHRPEIVALFQSPFESRWIFDVEILMRLKLLDPLPSDAALQARVVEYPLERWHFTRDTRLKSLDFGRAALELGRIGWKLRSGRR